MTIWASWGPLNADGNPDYSKAASGELKIKGEIPGGRWSSHKVMIDGTKPDSHGFIAITGVLVGQIELFNAPAYPSPRPPSALSSGADPKRRHLVRPCDAGSGDTPEERGVGKGGDGTDRSRWSSVH